ncbi:MAG: tetratricopeptide repeat protein [Planctomycetaceae bacterium]|nr:tetratricopeptide repeat protein [Planctomycetaceae bacterium]
MSIFAKIPIIPHSSRLARLLEMMNWIKSLTLCAVMLTAATLWADDALNLFNSAKSAFDSNQYDVARVNFENFLRQFPGHAKTNEATFWLAESFTYQRQYVQAETYFNRLVSFGLTDQFSKAALFRLAEIPYLQQQFDIAKPRLENFITQLEYDANNQFVMYYLGDIAMRNDAPLEAEHYFYRTNYVFPNGAKVLECSLGLAWAKNRLGKIIEANGIYNQLMSSTNPAIVEQATYQYGVALFERRAEQDAINALTNFQRQFPASAYVADSQRVIARCWGRLNEFEKGLQVLSQLTNPTPDDRLMQVRFLYGDKRTQEAKNVLDQVKAVAGTAYRDEITLLESVFLFEQRDWNGTIALLQTMLAAEFNMPNEKMVVHYFTLPPAPGAKKLGDEAVFRACSLLTLAYANSGDSARANALLREMQGQSALSGNQRLLKTVTDTETQLASIGPVTPGRPGGSLAGRNDQQWTPGGQNTGARPQNVQTSGTDLERFWNANRLYQVRNFELAAQQLELLLSGVYNQNVTPPRYTIFYNITGATGTMDEVTFARACSLLALARAQLGDVEQANAILMSLGSRIRLNDTVQQDLWQETAEQVAALARGGGSTNIASGSTQGPTLSELEQRRLLREANTAFRGQRFDQADARLTELITSPNVPDATLAEALLLQSKAKERLGWERDGIAILERIIDEFPASPQCPEALWLLGIYYESGGESYVAIEYFQMLADRFSNFKHIDGALYFLAVDDLANGNSRRASERLSRVHRNLRTGLYWSHATWMLAHEAYKKKDYATAERYIQEILRHPPDIAILDRVLYLRGELARLRNDHETAFLAFKAVQEHTPDSPLRQLAMQNARVAASKAVSIN